MTECIITEHRPRDITKTDQTLKAKICKDKQKNTVTRNQDDKTSVPIIYTIRPSRVTF